MNKNFKSTEALFAKIKEDFNTWDAASLIDDGRFHKDVKYIIHLLGIKWYRDAETILEVCNYKASLPDDFNLLESAWRCDKYSVEKSMMDGVVLKQLTFDHYPETDPDYHTKYCGDSIRKPSTCIFNRQEEILVQRYGIIEKYTNPILLRPSNVDTRKCCTGTCQNIHSRSTDTFSLANKKIYVNFKDGNIFLDYNAFPYDEETGYPMIPDNEVIEKCIEYYIKKNILENLWINGEGDVERRYLTFTNLYKEHLAQAQTETKTPSFSSMVQKIRLNKKSLNIYQL